MSDTHKEATTEPKVIQFMHSFKTIIVGLILLIASMVFTWWNEGHAIHNYQILSEGRGIVRSIPNNKVDHKNNDALVHIHGQTSTNEELNDIVFGVKVNAIKLRRNVQMYQWIESTEEENKKKFGIIPSKAKNYTYNKIWSEKLIDSSKFNNPEEYKNPTFMPFHSQTFIASNVYIENFKLSEAFVEQLNLYSNYPLSQENFDLMSEKMHHSFQLSGTEYFQGDAREPEIGAIRINYTYVKPSEISIIGKQTDSTITPYYTQSGSKIALLKKGMVDANAMFTWEELHSSFFTWVFRLCALIATWAALGMIIKPFILLIEFLPCLGNILKAGSYSVSCISAIALTLLNIALAWLYYRPIISVIMMLFVIGMVYLYYVKKIKTTKKIIDNADDKQTK